MAKETKNVSYAVALTGSIATGKSTVAIALKSQGYAIIDADTIAHKVLELQQEQVIKMFGSAIVKEQKIDRKKLGKIVFSSQQKRQQLQNLIHPMIKKEIDKQCQKLDKLKSIYLVDIPLFFETRQYPINHVIVVYAKKQQQLTRLMQRDNIEEEEALVKIDTQLDIEEKKSLANFIIDNSGNKQQLIAQCQYCIDWLKQLK